MNRNTIRKLIGSNAYNKMRGFILSVSDIGKSKLETDFKTRIFHIKGKHVFFGYYDIPQLSEDEHKMLVHVADKKANENRDFATVGYYDIKTGVFQAIGPTNAWCWQQGARLRWHPTDPNLVLFNNVSENCYVTEASDLRTGAITVISPCALYDISSDFSYGLSLNFSRLQRLRPGYGYLRIPDKTVGDKYPSDDGIFRVDLASKKVQLIIRLDTLAESVEDADMYEHYINHINISPDNAHFIFFHIMAPVNKGPWKTRLLVAEPCGTNLRVLETSNKVSHYAWKNNSEILMTCYENKKQFYALYNIVTGKKTIYAEQALTSDGHPSFFSNKNCIVSDTYPDKRSYQELFKYDNDRGQKTTIARLYHSPFMDGDRRCDLHPRLSKSEKLITIDTAYRYGCRSCVVIQLQE